MCALSFSPPLQHGDRARTVPSVGTIIGCRTEIIQLDVIGVRHESRRANGRCALRSTFWRCAPLSLTQSCSLSLLLLRCCVTVQFDSADADKA